MSNVVPFGVSRTADPAQTYSYFAARGGTKKQVDSSDVEFTTNGFRIHFRDPVTGERDGYFVDRDLRPGADARFSGRAGEPPQVYFPIRDDWEKVLGDPSYPLIITEGPVKGIVVNGRKLLVVTIQGLHSWHVKGSTKLLSDFDLIEWEGRDIITAFDHDVLHNVMSQSGLKRLWRRLMERGARVLNAEMPNLGDGKTGIDDVLAAKGHGLPAVRKLLKAAKPATHDDYRHWGLPAAPRATDTSRAKMFRDLFRDELRYCKARDAWYVRQGHLWLRDNDDRVFGMVRNLIDLMLADAADEIDKDNRKAKYRNAEGLESFRSKESLLREAGTLDEFRVSVAQIDADPTLFGVRNGILDLSTGKLLDAPPTDSYVTLTGRVEFERSAKCPIFLEFLDGIFDGDKTRVAFLQRSVGYMLTGLTTEQCFWISHGFGANGKSTFTGVLKELFGDYCRTVDVDSLMAQRYSNASGPKEDIARLAGARLVLASETEESKPLAESLIKQMTGGENLTARELYKNSFEFTPQFKILLVANHIPIVKGTDNAIWRRIKLVPFDVTIPPSKQDPALLQKLLAELPGILNWALKGYQLWRRSGLRTPRAVDKATAEYRSDMDIVGRFLEECATVAEGLRTSSKAELYTAFAEWCKTEGIRQPMQAAVLGKKLVERGINDGKSGNVRYYKGVQLSPRGDSLMREHLRRQGKQQ